MIVVDASLATKWILVEPDSAAATNLLAANTGQLHAPDLLIVEVASAIVRTANMDKGLTDEMGTRLSQWTGGRTAGAVELHSVTRSLVAAAGAIAISLGHPLKDCIYLALAEQLGAELATCEARFRDRAAGTYPRVRLLADYG